ncbi:MAG: LytTR family transcriptional regulator [Bacteroidetes bacterium]|nr:MAG: LytTR family transcriptional regulator [Bacteroidota bacterium]
MDVPVRVTKSFLIEPFFVQTIYFKLIIIGIICLLAFLFFKVNVLSYNKDVTRKFILLLISKLKQTKKIQVKNIRDGSLVNVPISSIQYLRSDNNHIIVHLEDGQCVESRITLKVVLKELNKLSDDFLQVHRSYIINRGKISAKHSQFIMLGDDKIPIGRVYKKDISNLI